MLRFNFNLITRKFAGEKKNCKPRKQNFRKLPTRLRIIPRRRRHDPRNRNPPAQYNLRKATVLRTPSRQNRRNARKPHFHWPK